MSSTLLRVAALRAFIVKIAGALDWLPLLLARVVIGWIFVESGWGKLHNLPKVIEYFGSLGIPAPEIQAPFAAATELICGALVLTGLFTRVASVPLVVTMVVALLTAKKADINGLSDLFATSEFLYIVLLGTLSAFGAGAISIDKFLVSILEPAESESGSGATLASAR